jgi:hypothetical protein
VSKFVQGIIIRDSYALYAFKTNDDNSLKNFLINGEINEGESPSKAIERIVKERLNINSEIVFKLNRELYGNMTTFLIEIDNDSLRDENSLRSMGFRWLSLHDKESFSYNDKLQLRNLMKTCINKNYSPEWLRALDELVRSDVNWGNTDNLFFDQNVLIEHREIDSKISYGKKLSLIIMSLIIGSIFSSFFSSWRFGISIPIFIGVVIAIFLYTHREDIKKVSGIGLFTLTITFLLSLTFTIHSNEILLVLNLLAVPLLLSASFILLRYKTIEWQRLEFMFKVLSRIFNYPIENALKPIGFIKSVIRKRNKAKLSSTHKSILTGLLISIPLLLVILPLLASADSVFKYYISNFYTVFSDIEVGDMFWKIILAVVVSFYAFGYLWSFNYSLSSSPSSRESKKFFEPVTILTVLFVINIVYLLFTMVQSSYLYGGMESILPNGFTYSEYARRGFFELVLVTIINFTLLLICSRFTKKEKNSLEKALKAAYTILILFTLNMLYSANFKMALYEKAFGYTYLRIFVHLFLLLLLILFVIALAGIWIEKLPASKLSIIAALLMYVVVNYINVDLIIVRKNIERYNENKKIDTAYLGNLSYDALPEIIDFAQKDDNLMMQLKHQISYRKGQLNKDEKWHEFNYSKFKARKALNNK